LTHVNDGRRRGAYVSLHGFEATPMIHHAGAATATARIIATLTGVETCRITLSAA
jgi:hypothetical protein